MYFDHVRDAASFASVIGFWQYNTIRALCIRLSPLSSIELEVVGIIEVLQQCGHTQVSVHTRQTKDK